jgi:hypothetical protein
MTAVDAHDLSVEDADLDSVLLEVAELPWPGARSPELEKLARKLGNRALVEALDRPGPKRLGAIRLLGLL